MSERKTGKVGTIILGGNTYGVLRYSKSTHKIGGPRDKREEGILQAEKAQFNRIFHSAKLKDEVKNLQRRFGLPVPSRAAYLEWRGDDDPNFSVLGYNELGEEILSERGDRSQKFDKELEELAKRLGVHKNFYGYFRELAIYGSSNYGTLFPIPFEMGYPEARTTREKNGDFVREMIITPETDIDNPLVIEYIRAWQREHRDIPPQPEPLENKPRELDWQPVWEWHMRHPSVKIYQLAEMLKYEPATIRRKLAEVDEQMGTKGKPRGIRSEKKSKQPATKSR